MNSTERIHYLERVLSRACLESSPSLVQRSWASNAMVTRSSNRTHSQLHQLKRKLLRSALEEAPEAGLFKRLCGIANSCAESAWATSCPLLVFPCLFQEAAREICEQFQEEQSRRMEAEPWSVPGYCDPSYQGIASGWTTTAVGAE